MAKILKISGQEIDQALRKVTRQYLVGDLQKPQALQHVPSSLIEIGITRYENEGKLELPHRHKQAFEFQYMTAGLTAYLDLTTAEEHVFRKGDFYVIQPGAVYAQKSAPGTEMLFIKVPVDPTPEVERGIENQSKDRTAGMARRDYFYDAEAPKPNSIRPAAAVALFDSGGNILLRRKDNDKWTMPGGTLDFGESLTDSAIREAREENRASDSNHGSNRHIHRSPHFYRIQRQRSPPGIYIRLFRPD